jgi:hypothetical protein
VNTTDETIHLMREHARNIECGITGPVRITRKFNEVTCQLCVDAEYLRRHNKNCDTDCTCADRGRIPAQAAPQTPEYRDMIAPDGRHVLHLRVDRHHDHTAILVVTPMDTSLDRAFPTTAEADTYLGFLNEQVAGNVPLWQIEHNAGVLTSTSAALDHIDHELIDAVNEAMDQADLDRQAATEQRVAAEQAAIRGIVPAHPVTPTRSRVHTQQPTPAELARMRAHHNGRVVCDQGQPWTLLRGIVRRRYADPNRVEYWPGTRKIRAVWLNQRGWAAIGDIQERVA